MEEEHFPESKSSIERPLKLYSDNQDIAVWLDRETLTERGWMLDGTPASQVKWLPSSISIRLPTQGWLWEHFFKTIRATVLPEKEQRAGKNTDFLTFSKTTAPTPVSKSRLFFTEARIKLFAAKIKRIKKTLHLAELHLWNGTQEWI